MTRKAIVNGSMVTRLAKNGSLSMQVGIIAVFSKKKIKSSALSLQLLYCKRNTLPETQLKLPLCTTSTIGKTGMPLCTRILGLKEAKFARVQIYRENTKNAAKQVEVLSTETADRK